MVVCEGPMTRSIRHDICEACGRETQQYADYDDEICGWCDHHDLIEAKVERETLWEKFKALRKRSNVLEENLREQIKTHDAMVARRSWFEWAKRALGLK